MTSQANGIGFDVRLPHVVHHDASIDLSRSGTRERAVEYLVAGYGDSDEQWMLDLIRDLIRPDLTGQQVADHVQTLVALSGEAAHWIDQRVGHWAACEAAQDEYSEYLTRFATAPVDDDLALVAAVGVIDCAGRPVDELARRRGGA